MDIDVEDLKLIEDLHEPNEIENKLTTKGVPVERELLDVGDYLLPSSYACERKKGRDLMSSVMSGRLYEQLNNLCQFQHPILAIISDNLWRDFYHTQSKYVHKQYIGVLTTLTAKYPTLRVMHFDSDDMFADYLASLYKKLTEDKESTRPKPIFRKGKKIQIRMENCLTAGEGISVGYSKKFLDRYNSIDEICKATVDDMTKISGVGKSKAESLYKLLHSNYKEKLK